MRYFILFTLVTAAVAIPRSPQRIAGGEPTTIEQYPYVANLQYGWFGSIWAQACGGSLITARTILSAAHCFYGNSPSSWRVLLGTSYRSAGGTQFSVSELVVHPRYDHSTSESDVAIVRLAATATLSTTINLASIAGPNYVLPDGTPVTAVGYGRLSNHGASATQLQHVDVNLISQGLCAQRYAHLKSQPGFAGWPEVTSTMICAGILDVGGKDACQGDSGGPLAHNGQVLVGVASWNYQCADVIYPGVYARVSALSDWIVANGSA